MSYPLTINRILALLMIFVSLCLPNTISGLEWGKEQPIPENTQAIEPCTKEETIHFFEEILNTQGLLIGQRARVFSNTQEGCHEVYWSKNLQNFLPEKFFLNRKGRLFPFPYGTAHYQDLADADYTPFIAGRYTLYKGNIHNDGNLCYMLTWNDQGSGYYDGIYHVWKLRDGKLETIAIGDAKQESFYPKVLLDTPHDIFPRDHHADSFLIEKEGKVYLRFIEGNFCHDYTDEPPGGTYSLFTYLWENNQLTLVEEFSLSPDNFQSINAHQCDLQTEEICKTCQMREQDRRDLLRLEEVQKPADGYTAIPSCSIDELQRFLRYLENSDLEEMDPCIRMTPHGGYVYLGDWAISPLALQHEGYLDSSSWSITERYTLYQWVDKENQPFYWLQKRYLNPCFDHKPEDFWVFKLNNNKLESIPLEELTPYSLSKQATPFLIHSGDKVCLRFLETSISENPAVITYLWEDNALAFQAIP